MTTSGLIETAIALAFIFLLFSLLVSSVNEVILGHLTHLRSRVLEDGLKSLLSNKGDRSPAALQTLKIFWAVLAAVVRIFVPRKFPPLAASATFAEKILAHPLVRGQAGSGQSCPGYLRANTFVDAALDELVKLGTAAGAAPVTFADVSPAQLAAGLAALTDTHAKSVLNSVLAGATTMTEARTRLADWFNDSMGSITAAYKRHTQFWLYVWTILIVVWLNVDTIEITRRLVADTQFRGAIAERAQQFVQRPATNSSPATSAMSAGELQDEISRLQLPLGWGACTNQFTNFSLPRSVLTCLPWLAADGSLATNNEPRLLVSGVLSSAAPCPQTAQGWWLKLCGLLITIGAVSQGAPFWFDLLNRFTNLRAGGKRPETDPKPKP